MESIGMVGVHLGKRSFQLHGVREDGSAAFQRKVSRDRFLDEAARRGTVDPWLNGMLERKPPMVAAVALANKTAWTIWAMTTGKESYRVPGNGRAPAEAAGTSP